MNELKDYIISLRHIGHIVPDLKSAIASYQKIYGDVDVEIIPPFGEEAPTRFAFIKVGDAEFELIEPISEEFKLLLINSPSGGGGINHVAYNVLDIDAALNVLLEKEIKPGHVTPNGVVTIGNRKMVYLDPETTDGFLIELVETLTS